MKFSALWALFGVCLASLVAGQSHAADYPPADHHGADLILQEGDRIWGVHTNIGRFEIPSTATVTVFPYNPSLRATGVVTIEADRIDVLGTLDATGAGYTGGGGGLGGPGTGTPGHYLSGKPGFPGKGRYPGFPGPAIGDGPFGGTQGGYPRTINGEDGGYGAEATNGDPTTDSSIRMGSGGQGGLGYPTSGEYYGEPSGGGGGSGGGRVLLWAKSTLELHGLIATRGTTGQNGEDGHSGSYTTQYGWDFPFPPPPSEILVAGGDGADGGSALPWEEGKGGESASISDVYAGNGGAGAGGGVLLICETANGLVLQGSIDARGGRDQMTNGGTVKLFYRGDAPTTSSLQAPRIYLRDLTTHPLPPAANGLLLR